MILKKSFQYADLLLNKHFWLQNEEKSWADSYFCGFYEEQKGQQKGILLVSYNYGWTTDINGLF